MEKGVGEDNAGSGKSTWKAQERGMVNLGNQECERSRERVWLERYIEALCQAGFGILWKFREVEEDQKAQLPETSTAEKTPCLGSFGTPEGLAWSPVALQEPQSQQTWEGHCSPFCFVPKQKHTPAPR